MTRFIPLLMALAAAAQNPPATPPAAGAAGAPTAPARDPGLYATITTTKGVIVAKLFEKESPATVRNFVSLSRGGKSWKDPNTGQMVTRPLLPGTQFHRVIPGFMIQGGDPTATGAYDPGFVIPDEFDPSLKFDTPGRFGMANAGPRTSSSQFFITEVPTPHLNGKHTIFGQVVEGQNVVNEIARVPRDPADKPRVPVKIVSIRFAREGPVPPGGISLGAPAGAAKKAPVATGAGAAKKATTPPAAKKAPTK